MWDQSRHALEFFAKVPFWKMSNANAIVTNNNWCLVDRDGVAVVLYLPSGGTADIDLTGVSATGSSFSIQWYDPSLGGDMVNGTIVSIAAGTSGSIGDAPGSATQDWAVLLRCTDCQTKPPIMAPVTTSAGVQTTPAPSSKATSSSVVKPTAAPVSQTSPVVMQASMIAGAPSAMPMTAPVTQKPVAPVAMPSAAPVTPRTDAPVAAPLASLVSQMTSSTPVVAPSSAVSSAQQSSIAPVAQNSTDQQSIGASRGAPRTTLLWSASFALAWLFF